jgi:osmotically-inducible protein OsmY
MNAADEQIRDAITDALSRQGIDARNLSVEVSAGAVSVRGSVPSNEPRARVAPAVGAVVRNGKTAQIVVKVIPETPGDRRPH